jgi:hypothetical protein
MTSYSLGLAAAVVVAAAVIKGIKHRGKRQGTNELKNFEERRVVKLSTSSTQTGPCGCSEAFQFLAANGVPEDKPSGPPETARGTEAAGTSAHISGAQMNAGLKKKSEVAERRSTKVVVEPVLNAEQNEGTVSFGLLDERMEPAESLRGARQPRVGRRRCSSGKRGATGTVRNNNKEWYQSIVLRNSHFVKERFSPKRTTLEGCTTWADSSVRKGPLWRRSGMKCSEILAGRGGMKSWLYIEWGSSTEDFVDAGRECCVQMRLTGWEC